MDGFQTYLCNHHVAVEETFLQFPVLGFTCRSLDMRADFGDDGGSKGDVGNEVAIHLSDMSLGCGTEL